MMLAPESPIGALAWERFPEREALVNEKFDEITRLTVDPSLSETERIIKALEGGHPVQQTFALRSIPALLKTGQCPGSSVIFLTMSNPPLFKTFPAEVKVAAGEAFGCIARDRLLSSQELAQYVLPLAGEVLDSSESTGEVLESWLAAMRSIIPQLDPLHVFVHVVGYVKSITETLQASVQTRLIATHLLGIAVVALSKEEVETRLLDKILFLCQDTDYIVRVSMCQQLPEIGKGVGPETTVSVLLPEVFELTRDEEPTVRAAALTCLVDLFPLLPLEVKRSRIIPYLRELCSHVAELATGVQRCLSFLLPQILSKVMASAESEIEGSHFLAGFRALATSADPQTRENCAAGFAAVLRTATARRFATHLHDAFGRLAADPEDAVRGLLASQVHEVATILGVERCQQFMRRPVIQLLGDGAGVVRSALAAGLQQTLVHFQTTSQESQSRLAMDLAGPLLSMESSSGLDWRLQYNLVVCFPTLCEVCGNDCAYEQLLPVAFRYLVGAAAVRMAAADAVVAIFRANRKPIQRTDIYGKLIREYARSRSCSKRAVFADICMCIVKRFSVRFFKEFFLEACLEGTGDVVPNVRMKFASLLPTMKATVRLPEDVALLERLNSAMASLTSDADPDVAEAALKVADAFRATHVHMTGGAGLMDMNGLSGSIADVDVEDLRKEEEEAGLLFITEEIERLRSGADVGDRKGRLDATALKNGKKGHQRLPAPTDARSLAAGRLRRPSAGPLDASAGLSSARKPVVTLYNHPISESIATGRAAPSLPTAYSGARLPLETTAEDDGYGRGARGSPASPKPTARLVSKAAGLQGVGKGLAGYSSQVDVDASGSYTPTASQAAVNGHTTPSSPGTRPSPLQVAPSSRTWGTTGGAANMPSPSTGRNAMRRS